MRNEIVATAIQIVGCHDVVACLDDVLQRIGDGSSSAGNSETSHTSLEGSHAVFEDALCGIGQTAIDVACIAKAEAVGCVLTVAEHIAGGLVDGHRTCIGCGVGLLLAYMKLQSLKVEFLAHSLIFFRYYVISLY